MTRVLTLTVALLLLSASGWTSTRAVAEESRLPAASGGATSAASPEPDTGIQNLLYALSNDKSFVDRIGSVHIDMLAIQAKYDSARAGRNQGKMNMLAKRYVQVAREALEISEQLRKTHGAPAYRLRDMLEDETPGLEKFSSSPVWASLYGALTRQQQLFDMMEYTELVHSKPVTDWEAFRRVELIKAAHKQLAADTNEERHAQVRDVGTLLHLQNGLFADFRTSFLKSKALYARIQSEFNAASTGRDEARMNRLANEYVAASFHAHNLASTYFSGVTQGFFTLMAVDRDLFKDWQDSKARRLTEMEEFRHALLSASPTEIKNTKLVVSDMLAMFTAMEESISRDEEFFTLADFYAAKRAHTEGKPNDGYDPQLLKAARVLLSAGEHTGVKGREAVLRRELGVTGP
jgi:hypothetical protein